MVELGHGWTQETVIRLVDEYKKKPELWDTSHESYRVHTWKYEAWRELAAMFECDMADLRRKINSILASMRREKLKVRCGARSNWFLYEHLSFLPRYLPNIARKTPKNTESQRQKIECEETEESDNDNTLNQEDDEEDDGEEEQELVYIKQEPTAETYVKPASRYKQTVSKPRLTRTIKKKVVRETSNSRFREVTANSRFRESAGSRLDSKILETLKLIKRSDFIKKKDECDSFGEYIADSLRKHDERTQCMIKQAINNILFEQEMKKYGPYEVILTSVDENPLVLEDSK